MSGPSLLVRITTLDAGVIDSKLALEKRPRTRALLCMELIDRNGSKDIGTSGRRVK